MKQIIVLMGLIISLTLSAFSIYVNYNDDYVDYFKSEMEIVDFTLNKDDADVFILIDGVRVGGGWQYNIFFFGQKTFYGLNDTFKLNFINDVSDYKTREGMLNIIKKGLVRYISKTDLSNRLIIDFEKREKTIENKYDPWNGFFSQINVKGNFWGENSIISRWAFSSFSLNKIKEDNRTKIELFYSYNYDEYIIDTINSRIYKKNEYGGEAEYAQSINNHFSGGGFLTYHSSTYMNYKHHITVYPGIEWNIFPYKESTTRQLRFQLKPIIIYNQYIDTTVYDKMEEYLVQGEFKVITDIVKSWGSINSYIQFSNYLHDFSKYNISFYTKFNTYIYNGLSFYLSVYATIPRDRIYLSKEGATPDEILLRQQALATDYTYMVFAGFTFTFGSKYRNIVNVRLE